MFRVKLCLELKKVPTPDPVVAEKTFATFPFSVYAFDVPSCELFLTYPVVSSF